MTTINLHGKLGEVVGRVWKFAVSSVAEAVRAIDANSDTFREYMMVEAKDVEFRIIINGVDHTETAELQMPRSRLDSIDIVPVPTGSGGGLWQTIVGVVLLIVAVVFTFTPLAPAAGTLAAYAVSLIATVGLSLALGGISQMMSSSPKLGPGPDKRNLDNDKMKTDDAVKTNYLFGGVVNTTSQGNCVPIGYGRHMIGSALIGFGIFDSAIPTDAEFGDYTRGDEVNPFDNLPVFLYLRNSFFWSTYDGSVKRFTNLNQKKTKDLYVKFWLNVADTHTPGLATMRKLLNTVWYTFHGNRLGQITKKEAYSLYKAYGLNGGVSDQVTVYARDMHGTPTGTTTLTYKQATREQIIQENAWFLYAQVQPTEGTSL